MATDRQMVRFLSEADVCRCVTMEDAVPVAEEVLAGQGRGTVEMPPKVLLDLARFGYDGFSNSMPSYIHSRRVSGIKWGGGFAANYALGLPYMVQTLIMTDPETGVPRAIMSATRLTNLKTGAETAVAGKFLAPRGKPLTVTIVGLGDQGHGNLEAWVAAHRQGEVHVGEIQLFDINSAKSQQAAADVAGQFENPIHVVDDLGRAVSASDVVVTTTTSRTPVIKAAWIHKGMFLASLGSYQEFEDEAIRQADVLVVDNWVQNEHRGEFKQFVQRGEIKHEDIRGELPSIVAGEVPGREDDEQIILASLIGLGSIDLGIATVALARAEASNVGTLVSFFGQ